MSVPANKIPRVDKIFELLLEMLNISKTLADKLEFEEKKEFGNTLKAAEAWFRHEQRLKQDIEDEFSERTFMNQLLVNRFYDQYQEYTAKMEAIKTMEKDKAKEAHELLNAQVGLLISNPMFIKLCPDFFSSDLYSNFFKS